jgi:hypothetical protein
MAASRRPMFRNKALAYYARSRERDILPRFVAPRAFVFLWILMALLLIATLGAWLAQAPTYVIGSGVILDTQGNSETTAVIFLPETSSLHLRVGLPLLMQIGTAGPQLSSTIAAVEPGVMSPEQARKQYALNGDLALVITEPSIAVTVKLGPAIPAQMYAGSIVGAQVQVGTRRVLSLLPFVGQLIGD